MTNAAQLPIRALFRVAAGPRIGYGHLVRARTLSRALQITRPLISVRGDADAQHWATTLNMRPLGGRPAEVLSSVRPQVLVIDDPSARAARVWCAAARRDGIRVASVHDLGTAFCGADLAIDGSVTQTRQKRAEWMRPGTLLTGVRYAVLDDSLRTMRRKRRSGEAVLIALGGGPRLSVACRLALALRVARPALAVRVAGGFADAAVGEHDGITWLPPQAGLAEELSRCSAAITGGGISLYEAVTLRTPVVAWPVVNAQEPTVRAFERHGLAAAVLPGKRRVQRAVRAILAAVDGAGRSAATAAHAFDGRGASRAAAAITALVREAGA